jgi:hypothetical protein
VKGSTGGPPEGSKDDADRRSRSRAARILFNRRVVRGVAVILGVGLLYYSLFVVLPSEISWSAVSAGLQALSGLHILALTGSGLLVILVLGWTSQASLPRLSLYQGIESSATSQLTAFVVPPPGDMAVRFAMYRTYGFGLEASGAAVLIATIARYAVVAFMPLLGLALVMVTGQGTWAELGWLLGLGAVFVLVMWLLLRVVRSDAAAHSTGRWLQRTASRVIRLFHRTPPDDLEASVVSFGVRTRATIETNGRRLIASNLAWGLSNVLVMLLALRFTGLSRSAMSWTAVALATGLVMALNMLPIPGKDALAASVLVSILHLTTQADTDSFGTALLLYRLTTWILPMPIGGVAFFAWRWRVRRDTVTSMEVPG